MANTTWGTLPNPLDARFGAPMINLPIAEVLTIAIVRPNNGFIVSVTNENNRGQIPRIYAGSSLEQCVQAIMAEFVAAKLES